MFAYTCVVCALNYVCVCGGCVDGGACVWVGGGGVCIGVWAWRVGV